MGTRQFFVELSSGQAANYDFQVSDAPPLPAVFPDWVELPNGGTLVFIDGDGTQRTLTGASPGSRYPFVVRKIISCTQTVRAGTADNAGLPGPVGPQGPAGGDWTVTALKTADYTAAAGEFVLVSTAAAHTITLPTAVGVPGKKIGVKDAAGAGAATNNITIATTASQTIDATTPAAITTNRGVRVYVSDGANWFVD